MPVTPRYRTRGSAAWVLPHRSGRAWIALILAVVCIAAFRYYADRNGIGRDITFLVDIAILVAAFVAWRQVTV
jgi:hypothetical protein